MGVDKGDEADDKRDMRYLGGKHRIASKIVNYIQPLADKCDGYWEPFVGGANVISKIHHKSRVASDIVPCLVHMWRAVVAGWEPPDTISREEYERLRAANDSSNPLTAFAGYGCSFAGKFFGGYASSGERNYAANAKNSILKKAPTLAGVGFFCADYRDGHPHGHLIYCDPPYVGTTGYAAAGQFDHKEFWATVKKWSASNIVIVSEYTAPPDVPIYASIATKTDMRVASGSKEIRHEKLFMLAPSRLLRDQGNHHETPPIPPIGIIPSGGGCAPAG